MHDFLVGRAAPGFLQRTVQDALVVAKLTAEDYIAQCQMETHANEELAFDGVKGEDGPRLRRLLAQGCNFEKHVFDVGVALSGRPNQWLPVEPIQIRHAISQINWRIDGDIPLKFDQGRLISRCLRRKEYHLEPPPGE